MAGRSSGRLVLFPLILLLILSVTNCKKQPAVAELQIDSDFKPDDCHEVAEPGDEVFVHYTGSLASGKVFDTSRQPDRQPISFKLGEGKVIPGWEMGIRGMCAGERRKLTIPPHLAYGKQGIPGTIPPDSTLLFETELVNLLKASKSFDMQPIFNALQFFSVPAVILFILYYVYDKYNKTPTKKEKRDEKRAKNIRKKKN